MTQHFHGTPITPTAVLYELAGRNFCVSYFAPRQVGICHQIGQAVMLDNGAFSAWKLKVDIDWLGFYAWCEKWLFHPTTWAVIPDVITGDEAVQDALIAQWPHGNRGVPVWHMHEGIDRLLRLIDKWGKVCIGSSKQYATLLTEAWCRRQDEAWNAIWRTFGSIPWVHMLRGMQMVFHRWPFASVDSTDIARNHNRPHNSAKAMAERWDARQCPGRWELVPEQLDLLKEVA